MKKSLYIFILLLLSCSGNETQTEKPDIEFDPEPIPEENHHIDQATKLRILNTMNDLAHIYIGTKTYDSIVTKYPKLKFKMGSQHELYKDATSEKGTYSWLLKRDTVFFDQNKDTIKITRIFYSVGHCWQYYPYVYEHSDTIDIYCPEQMEGHVMIENNDTVKVSEACPTETITDIVLYIPNKKKYKKKIMRFENRTYQIK